MVLDWSALQEVEQPERGKWNSVIKTKGSGTLPDAPSPWGGSCRYIGRFASQPTKAVSQLQPVDRCQAGRVFESDNHCATHVGLLHGQGTEVVILFERVVRSRDKTEKRGVSKRFWSPIPQPCELGMTSSGYPFRTYNAPHWTRTGQ